MVTPSEHCQKILHWVSVVVAVLFFVCLFVYLYFYFHLPVSLSGFYYPEKSTLISKDINKGQYILLRKQSLNMGILDKTLLCGENVQTT